MVDRFALDTYMRELERYGGAAGMALCEELFHRDSMAALDAPPLDTLEPRAKLEALARPALLPVRRADHARGARGVGRRAPAGRARLERRGG